MLVPSLQNGIGAMLRLLRVFGSAGASLVQSAVSSARNLHRSNEDPFTYRL